MVSRTASRPAFASRRVVTVFAIKHKGRSANGHNIYELKTDSGDYRTASNGMAGTKLYPARDFPHGQRMMLMFGSRGTVVDVGKA